MNQHVKHLFAEWYNGQLNEIQQQQITAHLHHCEQCQHYFNRLSNALEAAGDIPDAVAYQAKHLAIPFDKGTPTEEKGISLFPMIRWAAIIIIALFSGVLLGTLGAQHQRTSTEWATLQQALQSIDAQLISQDITISMEYLAGKHHEN